MNFLALLAWLAGGLGFGLLVGGIAMIHVPSACITAGLCLLAWSWLADRAAARIRKPDHGSG